MNYRECKSDTLLVGFFASGGVAHVGHYVGYMSHPTYVIKTPTGQVSWAEHLTRKATPQEEVEYWRARALDAEAANSAGMTHYEVRGE